MGYYNDIIFMGVNDIFENDIIISIDEATLVNKLFLDRLYYSCFILKQMIQSRLGFSLSQMILYRHLNNSNQSEMERLRNTAPYFLTGNEQAICPRLEYQLDYIKKITVNINN